MAPVKVFGPAMSTSVTRVLVCLEEVGAEYEVVDLDFKGLEHKIPSTLPETRSGKSQLSRMGICFSSSRARFLRYLLRKYKTDEVDLLREGNPKEAAMVDVWTEVEAHTYHPALSPVVYECLINPLMRGVPTDEKVVGESLEKLKKVLEVYEARLSTHRYLAGDFVSFADLNHFTYTFYFMATPHAVLLDSYPHLKAWWGSLMASPAMKKISASMVLAKP